MLGEPSGWCPGWRFVCQCKWEGPGGGMMAGVIIRNTAVWL